MKSDYVRRYYFFVSALTGERILEIYWQSVGYLSNKFTNCMTNKLLMFTINFNNIFTFTVTTNMYSIQHMKNISVILKRMS